LHDFIGNILLATAIERARETILSNNNQYTCREYREEMLLLGLRRRLAAEDLADTEKRVLEEQIRQLENTMQMD